MVEDTRGLTQGNLQFNAATVKQAYNHIKALAGFKYKEPIKTLKSRHHGYEAEDFIQETMQIILNESQKKSFPTINHLKAFINKTMSFHYLKEKRKYFYTKQRGSAKEVSIDDNFTQIDTGKTMLIAEMLTYDKDEDKTVAQDIDVRALTSKHLYVVYDWKNLLEVCTLSELKDYKTGYALSVNHLVQTLTERGERETCKYYKSIGFFMTKSILDSVSSAIIKYIKDNHIVEVAEDKPVIQPKYFRNETSLAHSTSPIFNTISVPECLREHRKRLLSGIL